MKQVRTAFVTGLLVLVPLMATIDILRWFVRSIDAISRQYLPSFILPIDFPGLGLIIALLLVFILGAITQNFVGQWFIKLFDSGIRKMPVVGGIYGTIKKFLETILNPQSDKFKGVVLIQFPRQGIYSIGFRTGRPDPNIIPKVSAAKNLTNIFVPCTPNPTSGFYILVPEEELISLDLSVQEAFKIVVSMGIITSDDHAHHISTEIQPT